MINCLRQKILRFLRINTYDPIGRLTFSTLELEPGDILVLSTEQVLSSTYKTKLCEHVQSQLPRNHQVIILEAGMTLGKIKETKND